ncbi:MAG: TraB/GumN family protein [Bacteroidales bacterium]|nr:TraB/GumN family protein [Bacteroidales bacterium]
MVNSLEPLLKSNSVFTAVGAAHLPGDYGIIQMLRKKGYTLTPVHASFTGIADSIMGVYEVKEWFNYKDSITGFSVDVCSKPVSYKMFGGLLDMKACYDRMDRPSFIFYAIPSTVSNPSNSEKILNEIYNRLSQNSKFEILSKKSITHKNIKGLELKARSFFYLFKIRMFYLNDFVYFLMAGSSEDLISSEETTRFFNSLTFSEPIVKKNITVNEWLVKKYEKGAYTINFPSEPHYIHKEIPDPDNLEDEPIDIHLFISINQKTKETYMMRWNDLPTGYHYHDDSLVYQELFASFLGEDYVFDRNKCKALLVNDVIGYEPLEAANDEGVKIRMKAYVRGNRVYFLIAQYAHEADYNEMDNFFDSFRTIPFIPTQKSMQKIEGINMSLPSKPILINETEESGSWYSQFANKIYACTDKNNGTLYTITVNFYPKYYRTEHLDSFYLELEEENRELDQNLTDTAFGYTPKGDYYRKGTRNSDNTSNRIKYWLFTKSNKSLKLQLMAMMKL